MSDAIANEVNEFFKVVLEIFMEFLALNLPGLFSIFGCIFDSDATFYLNKGPRYDLDNYRELFVNYSSVSSTFFFLFWAATNLKVGK